MSGGGGSVSDGLETMFRTSTGGMVDTNITSSLFPEFGKGIDNVVRETKNGLEYLDGTKQREAEQMAKDIKDEEERNRAYMKKQQEQRKKQTKLRKETETKRSQSIGQQRSGRKSIATNNLSTTASNNAGSKNLLGL